MENIILLDSNKSVISLNNTKNGVLQLSSIIVKDDYRKKWDVDMSDFVCLTKDGKLVNDSLLRIGGIGDRNISDKKYFMLIKYYEAFYSNEILKMCGSSKKEHLEGRWCIFNNSGEIKFEAPAFKNPYIVNNSCIYSFDQNYYNIDTGYFYCRSYNSCQSDNYLFLENKYDKDELRHGVMKIKKSDGSYEIL